MVSIKYPENPEELGELFGLLQDATKQLESILGERSASTVTATWDRSQDRLGREIVSLELSDWTGVSSALFDPTEFRNKDRLRRRLLSLWGDHLQDGSNRQMRRIQDLVNEGE